MAKWAEEEAKEGWKATNDATKDVQVEHQLILNGQMLLYLAFQLFGNMPSQMKQFLDIQGGLRASGKTVNKVVSAMTSAQNPHGGQEATLLSLYTSMMHFGLIIATPCYSDQVILSAGGNP